MLGRIWNYISTNPLVSGVLALFIFSILGTTWASLASAASSWFWTDAHVSRGGVLILSIAIAGELVVIYLLSVALRRRKVMRAIAVQPEGRSDEKPEVGTRETVSAPARPVTPEPRLPEPIQAIGPPAPTTATHGVAGPTPSVAPTMMTAGAGSTVAGGVAPATAGVTAPTPVELANTEAAVLRWCGNQWQPGIPVGVSKGALELSMSALQVAQAVDGLHSKGLVSKTGPNYVYLTPAGRELCVERGWHGGLEAARQRDPRSPSV